VNTANAKPVSNFIHSLPKAELHLHLEGSVTPETLVELRQGHGKESTLAEAESLYQYKDFLGFLMAFKTLTDDLETADDYELITYRLMEQLKAESLCFRRRMSVAEAGFRCHLRGPGARA
jgi:aminodeoxyfutalosine deaminase